MTTQIAFVSNRTSGITNPFVGHNVAVNMCRGRLHQTYCGSADGGGFVCFHSV